MSRFLSQWLDNWLRWLKAVLATCIDRLDGVVGQGHGKVGLQPMPKVYASLQRNDKVLDPKKWLHN